MRRLLFTEVFQNKVADVSEENIFQKPSNFATPQNKDRGLDHQIYVLNNLNLEIWRQNLKAIFLISNKKNFQN